MLPIFAALIISGCLCIPGEAQPYSGIRSRFVHGSVTDRNGRPVRGAEVELQDMHTLGIRSYMTQKNGEYHFGGLYSNVRYQLRVRYRGAFGPVKVLNRFNPNTNVTMNLSAPGS